MLYFHVMEDLKSSEANHMLSIRFGDKMTKTKVICNTSRRLRIKQLNSSV